ncbi:hypothetical protein AMS68_004322 [Peltaster fructicola]|uniref:Uncharacterized protein n=1 Tax=Peltaster fructicola TaxID=286661 RepID=A0A6H0XVX0_9PEZI|nr:hypothetical protein AMS68_004322 [Peltaster fructicola]
MKSSTGKSRKPGADKKTSIALRPHQATNTEQTPTAEPKGSKEPVKELALALDEDEILEEIPIASSSESVADFAVADALSAELTRPLAELYNKPADDRIIRIRFRNEPTSIYSLEPSGNLLMTVVQYFQGHGARTLEQVQEYVEQKCPILSEVLANKDHRCGLVNMMLSSSLLFCTIIESGSELWNLSSTAVPWPKPQPPEAALTNDNYDDLSQQYDLYLSVVRRGPRMDSHKAGLDQVRMAKVYCARFMSVKAANSVRVIASADEIDPTLDLPYWSTYHSDEECLESEQMHQILSRIQQVCQANGREPRVVLVGSGFDCLGTNPSFWRLLPERHPFIEFCMTLAIDRDRDLLWPRGRYDSTLKVDWHHFDVRLLADLSTDASAIRHGWLPNRLISHSNFLIILALLKNYTDACLFLASLIPSYERGHRMSVTHRRLAIHINIAAADFISRAHSRMQSARRCAGVSRRCNLCHYSGPQELIRQKPGEILLRCPGPCLGEQPLPAIVRPLLSNSATGLVSRAVDESTATETAQHHTLASDGHFRASRAFNTTSLQPPYLRRFAYHARRRYHGLSAGLLSFEDDIR